MPPSSKHKGHHSHASSTQDPVFIPKGRAPSVGQTRPYDSGSNAHGKHEPVRRNVKGVNSRQSEHFYAKPAAGPGKGKSR